MGILFLLGMMAFSVGICRIFQRAIRWSMEITHGDDRGIGGRDPRVLWEIPDTVPSEWVSAYRTEQGG